MFVYREIGYAAISKQYLDIDFFGKREVAETPCILNRIIEVKLSERIVKYVKLKYSVL